MATMKKAQKGAKITNPADDYKGMKNAKGKPANIGGGEGKIPPFPNGRKGMPYAPTKMGGAKNGKTMTKAKNGKSFPDLNKDGKVTKADILKGRGVIAKKGATIKKAQSGIMAKASKAISGAADKAGKWIKAHQTGGAETERQRRIAAKNGKSMKKCKYGCN
mgnify:CR=1 FL=1